MFRYRKSTKQRTNHHDEQCPFCYPPVKNIVLQTQYSSVLKNTFPYDLWEFREVTEHYMVVPKRHVKSLSDLTLDEQVDIMKILAEYEGRNFDIYARSSNSVQRTVPLHQHTHLIKTNTKHAKAALYLRKPYFVAKV